MNHAHASTTYSAPTPSLEELQVHQRFTSAAHQVVGALLPSAAMAVEKATCNVTEHLAVLSTLLRAQQAKLEQASPALGAEMQSLHAEMQQTITQMIVELQFQDRNSQLMESAVHILQESVPLMPEHTVIPSMVVRLHAIGRARTMLAHISISEVRQMMVETLENLRILPRKSKLPSGDSAGQVELF